MDKVGKNFVRLGIQVGLSLGAIVGLVGCGEAQDDIEGQNLHGLSSINGLSSLNGLSAINGLSSLNGLTALNGLSSMNGLSSLNGLMTTDGGRMTVQYLVRCALAAGDSLTKQDQNGVSYTFPGGMGLCPAWKNGGVHGPTYRTCQNLVSACMMAHVNTAGVHIPIWMDSEAPQIGWGVDPVNYPSQEGTFFGNIIETGDLSQLNMVGVTGPAAFYCEGSGFADGTVQGRLGVGQAGANLPYKNAYGGKCDGNQNFTGQYSRGTAYPADGFKRAHVGNYDFQNGEPITVWRNPGGTSGGSSGTFNPSTSYRLMPKHVSGKSMDVAYASTNNGTAVQQWGTNSNTAQKFNILASGSNWKIAMNIAQNKCIGPQYNGTGNATVLEVQDCNGSNNQAWIAMLVWHHRHVQLQERGGEPLHRRPGRQHGGRRPDAAL